MTKTYEKNLANIKLKAAMLLLKANQNPATRVHESAVEPFLNSLEAQYEIGGKSDPTVKHKLRLDDLETIRYTVEEMPFVLETSVEKVIQEQVEEKQGSITHEQAAKLDSKTLWRSGYMSGIPAFTLTPAPRSHT